MNKDKNGTVSALFKILFTLTIASFSIFLFFILLANFTIYINFYQILAKF